MPAVKHLLPLLFVVMLLLGACTKTASPTSPAPAPDNVVSKPSRSTVLTAASNNSSAASEEINATTDTPAQLSETGAAETVEPAANGSQELALRIAQPTTIPVNSTWKEGVNYRLLSPTQPTSAMPGQVEVTAAFWYGCAHCYAFETTLESWRKQGKAGYVSFVRLPIMWDEIQRTHARLFYTAQLLGKLDEMHSEVFREIQHKEFSLTTTAGIKALFIAQGTSEADFQRAYNSIAVEASLRHAQTLAERYRVTSVPAVIINGKYVTDVAMAGGLQQLTALINELAAREKGL